MIAIKIHAWPESDPGGMEPNGLSGSDRAYFADCLGPVGSSDAVFNLTWDSIGDRASPE